MKEKIMKKKNTSNVVRGIGIAMAVGGATAIVGSSMMNGSRMDTMKKNVTKVIKSMENFVGNM